MNLTILDQILLLVTGLVAIYLLWRFYGRYQKEKALYEAYYILRFVVLLVSGLLLIFLGWGILASPYVLTVASLIPLGISLGVANQYFPHWKKAYAWFALIGMIAIAVSAMADLETLKKIAIPRCCWICHLPRSVLRKRRSERLLVGRHRWCSDRRWRDCTGIPDSWITIIILQPGNGAPNICPSAFVDDLGIHIGFF
jgi:hypothetical protein